MDTIKALIPIGQSVRDTLCKELTSETCCTFKCCISGLHAVRAIIIGQLFQIRGFEIVRFVALCLLSSPQTHMNKKRVMQNTVCLTDARTKRSIVQFVQA